MIVDREAMARRAEKAWGRFLSWGVPLLLLGAIGLSFAPSRAAAQPWLGDRRRTEGPGFRVGNLELHPGVGVESGYENNLYLTKTNPFSTWLTRVSAHLLLSTVGVQRQAQGETTDDNTHVRQKIAFRGGAAVTYYHFYSAPGLDSVAADGSFALTVNPEGRFRLTLGNDYTRTIQPFTHNTPVGVASPSYARDRNVASIQFSARSPGNQLIGTLHYRVDYDIFEDSNFRYANSLTHDGQEQLSWRILPRTALVQQVRVRFRTYPHGAGGAALVSNGVWLESRAGINGAITQKLSTSLLAGYTAGFLSTASDFEGFNLRLQVRYRPRPSIDLRLGYTHGFNPSYVGNYAQSDQIDFRAQLLGFGALLVGIEGLVSFDQSGLAVDSMGMLLGNTETRQDVRLRFALFAEYRFTNWFGLDFNVAYLGDVTNYTFNSPSMAVIPDPGGAYNKVEVWLGARVFY